MISLVAFDIDGTLCFGETPAPGAIETVHFLQANCKVVYFTNNSTKNDAELYKKLTRLGFPTQLEDVYTITSATARLLAENGFDNLFVIGSTGLIQEIENQGLTVISNESADHVVVGMDFEFNYKKIATALNILRRGGQFVVCNTDANFPVEEGRFLPGCGAMVGAVRAATGRDPDLMVGKPTPYVLNLIAQTHGLRPENILVIGDSLESDIAMAQTFRSQAILLSENAPTDYDYPNLTVLADHEALLAHCRTHYTDNA